MKETIIILGAGVMQGPVINIAKELGFYAIALDGSKEAPCVSMADQFEQIDLKDKEGIEAFARSIQGTTNRLGIMTAGTDFSANVAWVAEKLGLPGIPYESALNASDKSRMRECFKKASLPSPNFITITEADLPLSLNSLLPIPPRNQTRRQHGKPRLPTH
jgi:biotin carboxylase